MKHFRAAIQTVTLIAIMAGCLWLGMCIEELTAWPAVVVTVIDYDSNDWPVPSPEQLQRRLGLKPDGKIGPVSRKAWGEVVGNQSAAKYFPKETK